LADAQQVRGVLVIAGLTPIDILLRALGFRVHPAAV
jgi:hypothetical protein